MRQQPLTPVGSIELRRALLPMLSDLFAPLGWVATMVRSLALAERFVRTVSLRCNCRLDLINRHDYLVALQLSFGPNSSSSLLPCIAIIIVSTESQV